MQRRIAGRGLLFFQSQESPDSDGSKRKSQTGRVLGSVFSLAGRRLSNMSRQESPEEKAIEDSYASEASEAPSREERPKSPTADARPKSPTADASRRRSSRNSESQGGFSAEQALSFSKIDDTKNGEQSGFEGFESVIGDRTERNRKCIEVCVAGIVGINIITVGLETELHGTEAGILCGTVNIFLLLFYIAELIGRFLMYGSTLFYEPLTVLDIITVGLSFTERLLQLGSRTRALVSLRMLRVGMVLGGSRMLQESKEIQLLVQNGFKIFITFGWWFWILFLTCFACQILTREVVGESGEWDDTTDPLEYTSTFYKFEPVHYFGSILDGSLTLLQISTLAQWADNVARPVVLKYPPAFLFFFTFCLFTSFGLVMSMISNMVCLSLAAQRDVTKAKKLKSFELRKKLSSKVLNLIEFVDEDKDGELSAEELDNALKRFPQVVELLQELEVPVCDGESLIRMLDSSGDGLVSYEEFFEGICNMDDELTPRDYTKLALRCWSVLNRIEFMTTRFYSFEVTFSTVQELMKDSFDAVRKWKNCREANDMFKDATQKIMAGGFTTLPPPPPSKKKVYVQPPREDAMVRIEAFTQKYLGSVAMGAQLHKSSQSLRGAGTADDSHEAKRLGVSRREILPGGGVAPPTSMKEKMMVASKQRQQGRDKYEMAHPLDQRPKAKLAWVGGIV